MLLIDRRRRNSRTHDYTPEQRSNQEIPKSERNHRENFGTHKEHCEVTKLRPILKRPSEVISCRVRTPPPVYECVVERAPTPEQEIVERVIEKLNAIKISFSKISFMINTNECLIKR